MLLLVLFKGGENLNQPSGASGVLGVHTSSNLKILRGGVSRMPSNRDFTSSSTPSGK